MALQPRRQPSSYSWLSEPQIIQHWHLHHCDSLHLIQVCGHTCFLCGCCSVIKTCVPSVSILTLDSVHISHSSLQDSSCLLFWTSKVVLCQWLPWIWYGKCAPAPTSHVFSLHLSSIDVDQVTENPSCNFECPVHGFTWLSYLWCVIHKNFELWNHLNPVCAVTSSFM
jgi:hypothetical protein